MFSPATQWIKKKTRILHFFIIDALFRVGEEAFLIQVMLVFEDSAKQSPKSDASSYPVIQGKWGENKEAFPRIPCFSVKGQWL